MNHEKKILKKFIVDGGSTANLKIAHDIWQSFPDLAVEYLLAPFFQDVEKAVTKAMKGKALPGTKWISASDWEDLEQRPNSSPYLCFNLSTWYWGLVGKERYAISVGCDRKMNNLYCGIDLDTTVEEWPAPDLLVRLAVDKHVKRKLRQDKWNICWEFFPQPYRNLMSLEFLQRIMQPESKKQVVQSFVDHLRPYFHRDILKAVQVAAAKRRNAGS